MSFGPSKRQRERDRQEHQRNKEQKKDARRAAKPDRPNIPGVDPDIAGIVPGPQPVPEDV